MVYVFVFLSRPSAWGAYAVAIMPPRPVHVMRILSHCSPPGGILSVINQWCHVIIEPRFHTNHARRSFLLAFFVRLLLLLDLIKVKPNRIIG